MRATGLLDDAARPAVHDHLAWTGHGDAGLVATARQVFAAAGPSERLVFLSDDGSTRGLEDVYGADLAAGRLVTMSALDTYAPVLDGGPDAATEQLRRFDDFVDAALVAGYSSLRVVADNTAMLAGTDEQAQNWLAWEQLTDGWQVRRPVTGSCYFDVDRLAPHRLHAALSRHPATVGDAVPWRVHFEQDDAGELRLALAGEVEAFDEPDVTAAILASMSTDPVVSDRPLELSLRGADYLHHRVAFAIAALADRDPGLRVADVSESVARLLRTLPPLAGFAA